MATDAEILQDVFGMSWVHLKTYDKHRGTLLTPDVDDCVPTFIKRVDSSKHFMRRNRSWAISTDIVDDFKDMAVSHIVPVVDGQRVLVVSYDRFYRDSTIEKWGSADEQYFLHESCWQELPMIPPCSDDCTIGGKA